MHVALFRNLNLGHAGSPTGATLIEAFGGERVARNFQTNGTVLFDSAAPAKAVSAAKRRLGAAGFHHHFVVRPLPSLAWIVSEAPSVRPEEGVYRVMASFFDAPQPALSLPLRSKDGLVELRSVHEGHAWSVCWKPRNTAGNATALLESLLGVPVTTRTAATLERLVRKTA